MRIVTASRSFSRQPADSLVGAAGLAAGPATAAVLLRCSGL